MALALLVAPREPELGFNTDFVSSNFDGLAIEADRLNQSALCLLHVAFGLAGEKAIVYIFYMLLVAHV